MVVSARCWEGGGAPAFWPWVQIVRSCYERVGPERLRTLVEPSVATYLAHLLPAIAEVSDDPEPVAIDSEQARFALLDSVSIFLHRISREAPLVVLFDDLHAADESSL